MRTNDFVSIGSLKIKKPLIDLIELEVMPAISLDPKEFWLGLENIQPLAGRVGGEQQGVVVM